jgi:hypothetical protein
MSSLRSAQYCYIMRTGTISCIFILLLGHCQSKFKLIVRWKSARFIPLAPEKHGKINFVQCIYICFYVINCEVKKHIMVLIMSLSE